MLRVYKQWHTPVQNPIAPPMGGAMKPVRDLMKLITGIGPLYKQIQVASTNAAHTSEEREWLSGLVAMFDSIVGPILRDLGHTAWAPLYEIQADYEREYGVNYTGPTGHMLGRLMTRGEIATCFAAAKRLKRKDDDMDYDMLWRKKPQSPRLRTDCMGNRNIWTPRPAGLDPSNHAGIVERGIGNMYMMCCGWTPDRPGCWRSLIATQPENVVIPYRVMKQDPWKVMVDASDIPAFIKDTYPLEDDIEIGTAFKDELYYIALHERIQMIWKTVAVPIIKRVLTAYAVEVDEAINNDTPYSLTPVRKYMEPGELRDISALLNLIADYNIVQCGSMRESDWTDYIEMRLFKTYNISTHWTTETRAVLTLKNGDRVKQLPSNRVATRAELTAMTTNLTSESSTFSSLITLAGNMLTSSGRYYAPVNKTHIISIHSLQANGSKTSYVANMLAAYAAYEAEAMALQTAMNAALREYKKSGAITTKALISTTTSKSYPTLDQSSLDKATEDLEYDQFKAKATAAMDKKPVIDFTTGAATTNSLLQKVYTDEVLVPYNALTNALAYKLVKSQANPRAAARYATEMNAAEMTLAAAIAAQNARIEAIRPRLYLQAAFYNTIAMAPTQKLVARLLADVPSNFASNTKTRLNNITIYVKDKDAAVATYNGAIAAIDKLYNDAQALAKTTATTAATTVATLLAKDATDIADVNGQRVALLAAADALILIDDTNQLGIDIKRKIEQLYVPDATTYGAAMAAPQTAYLAAWNTSLVAAAANLANALKDLIASLDKTSGTRIAIGILDDAIKELSDQQPLFLSQQQIEQRDNGIITQRLSQMGPEFRDWINSSYETAFISTSTNGLKELRKLWDSSGKPIVRPFVKNVTVVNTITKKVDSSRDDLYHDMVNQDRIQQVPFSVGRQFWITSASFKPAAAAWQLFAMHLASLGTSKEVQATASMNAAIATLPAQPTSGKEVTIAQAVSSAGHVQTKIADYNAIPGIMTQVGLRWIDNSCWIDATLMALFNIPETVISNHMYNTREIRIPNEQLTFPDGTMINVPCDKDHVSLHNDILSDIDYIQSPQSNDAQRVCALRNHWMSKCVQSRFTNKMDDLGEMSAVLQTIQMLYPTIPFDVTRNGVTLVPSTPPTPPTPPKPPVPILPFLVGGTKPVEIVTEHDDDPLYDALKVRNDVAEYDTQGAYTLVAIIYQLVSNVSGVATGTHFIAHINDFAIGTWYLFDRAGGQVAMSILTAAEINNQMKRSAKYNGSIRRPAAFIFYKNDEVARIKKLKAIALAAAVAKVPVVLVPKAPTVPTLQWEHSQMHPSITNKDWNEFVKYYATIAGKPSTLPTDPSHLYDAWLDDLRRKRLGFALASLPTAADDARIALADFWRDTDMVKRYNVQITALGLKAVPTAAGDRARWIKEFDKSVIGVAWDVMDDEDKRFYHVRLETRNYK